MGRQDPCLIPALSLNPTQPFGFRCVSGAALQYGVSVVHLPGTAGATRGQADMKRVLIPVLAAVSLAAAIPAVASAAPWQSVNQRQYNLDHRIDQGVRNGSLTRMEAARLRNEFRALNRLEARYRVTGGGLSGWERADLDRRFDNLSRQIRLERHDRQDRRHRW